VSLQCPSSGEDINLKDRIDNLEKEIVELRGALEFLPVLSEEYLKIKDSFDKKKGT